MEPRIETIRIAPDAPPSNRSMVDLFTTLIDQMSLLFRKEIELAKAEMQEKASKVGAGMAKIVAGAVLMIPALVILLQAIVAWLDAFGLEPRWGFLIVGVAGLLIGYALLHSGLNAARMGNLTPRRTAEQLQRDAAVAKEQIR